MDARVVGTTMLVLEVALNPGEVIFSESGELSWMTAAIQMKTSTQAGGGGGIGGVFKRAVGGGSIFMTGSNASLRGYPNWSVYAASKAVLPAYARVWVSELRDRKIRVNVLIPGQVASPMLEAVMDAEMKAQFESVIPRREMGRPEEIASVALFLASDDSSYVNGMELVVDGGTTVI